MGRTSIQRAPVDADAERRPLRANRGARIARPRYRSVLCRFMSLHGPNQVMQPTASKRATYIVRVYHPHFGCVGRFRGLAVADLVLVRRPYMRRCWWK